MEAAVAARPQGRGAFEIGLFVFGAIAIVDVLTMFLAGAMHFDAVLKFALSIFVYVQMFMTGASVLSIPVTLVTRVARRGKPKAA